MSARELLLVMTAALFAAPAAGAEDPTSLDDLLSITMQGEPLHKVLVRLHANHGYTYVYPPGDLLDRPGPHMYIAPAPAPVALQQMAAAYGLCATVHPNAIDNQRNLVIVSTCDKAELRRKYFETGGELANQPPQVMLGIMIRDGQASGSSGTGHRGALVGDIGENTVAQAAGIQIGDVIVAFNGTAVEGGRQLTELVSNTQPGDEVVVIVIRDGGSATLIARF